MTNDLCVGCTLSCVLRVQIQGFETSCGRNSFAVDLFEHELPLTADIGKYQYNAP